MARIRTNLGWAFVYNLIGLPLAMGVLFPWTGWLLPPAFAAAAIHSLRSAWWATPSSCEAGNCRQPPFW